MWAVGGFPLNSNVKCGLKVGVSSFTEEEEIYQPQPKISYRQNELKLVEHQSNQSKSIIKIQNKKEKLKTLIISKRCAKRNINL